MLNLIISPFDRWHLSKKCYCFEFSEKMTTIRKSDQKPVIEFIYDEQKGQITVLTKDDVYYASKVEIKANEEEMTLHLTFDESEIKQINLNGKMVPIVYLKGHKSTINLPFED